MNHALPYREPCGGWGARDNRGGCFQHWRLREAQVPKWENVTRVVNWRCPNEFPGAKGTVPPYERPVGSPYGEGECSGGPPMWGALDWCNTPHTKPPCGYWSRPEFAASCSEGQERVDLNCYKELEGEIANLTRCQKVGFKNVQARKVWHGMFGFTSGDHAQCTAGAAPDGTKYLTMSRSLTYVEHYERWTGDPLEKEAAWDYTAHVDITATVNRSSGVITVPENGCHAYTKREIILGDPPITEGTDNFCDEPVLKDNLATLIACDGELWGGKGEGETVQIGGVTFTIDELEISNTEIKASLSYEVEPVWGGFVVNRMELTIHHTLADPYTAEQLKSDALALLEHWDMADDALYPWRRDRFTTVAPLVTYDEVPMAVTPQIPMPFSDSEGACEWTDANADSYTGEVLGKPFSKGWPEGRLSGQSQVEYFEAPGYGTEHTLAYLGATVTKVRRMYWDDTAEEYVEAFAGEAGKHYTFERDEYGAGTVTVVDDPELNPLACQAPLTVGGDAVGSCYAPHPDLLEVTYDFYWLLGGHFDHRHVNYKWREAGGDYTQYQYSGAWSGGSGAIDPTDACMPRTATQWTNTVQASLFPHGAWAIMFPGGDLWLQKYAEIKLPWRSQNWFGPCGADRDLAEYPNAWPIEGDRGCTFAEEDGTVTVTLDKAAEYLRAGDKVDFTTADGLTVDDNGGSGYTVDDVDNGTFTYSGAVPSAEYVRVKSHGAPGYWWYDSDGKGSYSLVRHTFDYRATPNDPGTAEPIIRDCLSFDRCWPAVMCLSPNYDSEAEETIDNFPHGKTFNFGTIVIDGRFGSRWSAFFVQAMVDLWWVAPDLEPPGEEDEEYPGYEVEYEEDDGACREDDQPKVVWPHRPLVECLEVRPDNWYPAGASLAPTYAEHTTEPTYAAMLPVGPTERAELPNETSKAVTPWVTWLAMQFCVCNEGRFAEDGVTTLPKDYRYRGYKNILGTWMCGEEPG